MERKKIEQKKEFKVYRKEKQSVSSGLGPIAKRTALQFLCTKKVGEQYTWKEKEGSVQREGVKLTEGGLLPTKLAL